LFYVEHGSRGGALFHVERGVNWVESGWTVFPLFMPKAKPYQSTMT
jgi:hypothetical protein